MAQTPEQRARAKAQRELAKNLRAQREGRASREQSTEERAYRRALERIRSEPPARPPGQSPVRPPSSGGLPDDINELRDLALENARIHFSDNLKFNDQRMAARIGAISNKNTLREMATISKEDWQARASAKYGGNPFHYH